MEHAAQLTITRPSYNDGRKLISIQVEDVDAGISFLELEISYENFSACLTGLGYVDCKMKVRGLENVGKVGEKATLEFEMPEHTYKNIKEIARMAAQKAAPEGWVASEYFDSQRSFFTLGDKEYARTTIYRWVDKQQNKED